MNQDTQSIRMACIEHLRKTLAVKPDPTLPQRTQDEQEAGRYRIMQNLRMSVIDIGVDELRARFGHGSIVRGDLFELPPTTKTRRWAAQVEVRGSERVMTFQDDLMEFPSDEIIAQIALIV